MNEVGHDHVVRALPVKESEANHAPAECAEALSICRRQDVFSRFPLVSAAEWRPLDHCLPSNRPRRREPDTISMTDWPLRSPTPFVDILKGSNIPRGRAGGPLWKVRMYRGQGRVRCGRFERTGGRAGSPLWKVRTYRR